MPGLTSALKAKVEAWIVADPDPATQAKLAATLEAAQREDPEAQAELAQAFAGTLTFGAVGLRGKPGPGPARMNRAVVMRATAGLMAYLGNGIGQGQGQAVTGPEGAPLASQDRQSNQPNQPSNEGSNETDLASRLARLRRPKSKAPEPPKVVIGYDARPESAVSALDAAGVVVAAGGRALLWERPCLTPLLAYAVLEMAADAGLMVTASRDRAEGNGCKIYLGGRAASDQARGVQIVPPVDRELAEHMAKAPPANQVKRAPRGWESIGDDLEREYLLRAVAGVAPAPGAADLRIVYTATRGLGSRIALPAFERAGFTDVHPVPEQARPDPDIPTVTLPEPEPEPEPAGAMGLATDLAERIGADLAIAHDSEAGRLAVAVFDPHGPRGGSWRVLTGDELGALLGQEAAKAWRDVPQAHDAARPALASSVVSSRLLARVARDQLLRHQRALPGMRWIARTPGLVFGYEEAGGYCVRPDLVRDGDGITAGLAVAKLAAKAKLAGKSLIDLLDDLARRHGLHATGQVSLTFSDTSRSAGAMRALRRVTPKAIGDVPVGRMIDLATGWEGMPPADVLVFSMADGSRVVVRPFGGEPKIECHLELVVPVPPTAGFAELTAIRARAAGSVATLAQAVRAILEPD
ncbi:MAG: hypothetical protein LBK95_09255 [Bifidobacteriaceae bacterium]|jgi:phosphomannomutase|nr:hypothetical protein [Bifidobacteriaceae bacterium]